MRSVCLSGIDTITLNNQPITNTPDGTVVELAYPNPLIDVRTGKNGNSIFVMREQGRHVDVKLRVIAGSNDDKFLNQLYNIQAKSFTTTPLLFAQFVKILGVRARALASGSVDITTVTYVLGSGTFVKGVDSRSNVDGDTEQCVSLYTMKFATCDRIL